MSAMNDWCDQSQPKPLCYDGRGLPCQKCGGIGYTLTYDHSHPDAIETLGDKSLLPCPNYKSVYIKPPRQDWDFIWMNLAEAIATRSTCNIPHRSIGCVITRWDNTKVLALGYNGSAKGDDNSCEYTGSDDVKVGSSRCTCVHAEMNALTKLDSGLFGKKRMYVTLSPCRLCYKLIVNANISELVYKTEHYVDVLHELERLGVETRKYEGGNN